MRESKDEKLKTENENYSHLQAQRAQTTTMKME